jgi:uncharacterized membrane protein
MKGFLTSIRRLAISGFFVLLPVFVILAIVSKVWTAMTSVGAKLAKLFGITSFVGFKGSQLFAGLLIVVICLACGLLVRVSFVAAFSQAIERWMSKYIPGYGDYRAIAEEKLLNKAKTLPYASALVKQQEWWLPAYVIEQDDSGNYVVFLPDVPETSKGRLLLVREEQIKLMPSLTANQLDASLRGMGKGLLKDLVRTDA